MKRVDWHVHSTFSDGADTVSSLLLRAKELELDSIAITDHFDPYDKGLSNRFVSNSDLLQHFTQIREQAMEYPVQVYCGIETCTDEKGELRVDAEVLRACDIVITSPHYVAYDGVLRQGDWMNDDFWAAYKAKLLLMATGPGDVLGHPEVYLPFKSMLPPVTTFEERLNISLQIADRYFDEAFIRSLGQALLTSGKAYELHGMGNSPRLWVIKMLHDMGVYFSIGSDAHTSAHAGCNQRAWTLAQSMGLRLRIPGRVRPGSNQDKKGGG